MEPEFFAVFHAGIHEEMGKLIVALDGLNDAELDRVLNAAQMVDNEAQNTFEGRRASNTESNPASRSDDA